MDDYNYNEEEGKYDWQPPPAAPKKPGDPGYMLPGWQPGYDPGPNWNNGIAPVSTDPYSNYNGGSPVDAPLKPGHGWEWGGTWSTDGSPVFNSETGNWDVGKWSQVAGKGIGYQAATNTGGGGNPQPPTNGGAVPPMPATKISIPSSTLPGDINSTLTQAPTQTPIQSAYQDALLKFMAQSQQTPKLDDPTLAPQVEVYRVQQQRNQERNRRSAAERAAATGLGQSGYLDRQIDQGLQEQNFNTAAYNANLLGGELDKRRKDLQLALQLASATGDHEAARELQTRLAKVSAQMQQQGLNLQGQLGSGDLSLRLMQTLLGNDQFYDQLGINTALNLEGLNQNALQSIFGGG
jgi:hypothetical protein